MQKECLAVVRATEQFRPDLLGCPFAELHNLMLTKQLAANSNIIYDIVAISTKYTYTREATCSQGRRGTGESPQ